VPLKRPRNATTTRTRLLEAACVAFAEDGYFGTDSNKIARTAGYSPATFYRHFPDKREILLAAYQVWVAAEWDAIQQVLAISKSSAGVARDLTRVVLEHHRKWCGLRRSLRAAAATDEKVRLFQLNQRRAQLKWLSSLRGGSAGRARNLALLLELERLCDAIAEHDSRRIGVPDREMIGEVERVIREYIG